MAKSALNSLVALAALLFSFGCTSSTAPTYLNQDLSQAIEETCKNQFNIEVSSKLVGRTLWVYLPVEDIFSKPEKPKKSTEKFLLEQDRVTFEKNQLKVSYLIKALTPEKTKEQEVEFGKKAGEKLNKVMLGALPRVIFSTKKEAEKKNDPQFVGLIVADIKNGILLQNLFYIEDFKKLNYSFISMTEFQHRMFTQSALAPQIIGDKTGQSINYTDTNFRDFLCMQIWQRIQMKFGAPEVEKHADINKEIIKTVAETIQIYNFKDFSTVDIENLESGDRSSLNQVAVQLRSTKE